MPRLAAFLLALLSLLCTAAQAQRYAVISLIGDRMQLAYAKGVDGQPVDRIERRYIPLNDTTIDRAALLAVNDKLRAMAPGSEPVLLQAFERPLFDISVGTAPIVDHIRQLVRDEKGPRVTHAIIIAKMQYDGVPALQKAYVGSGTLEGVGFFVGREPPPAGMDPNSGGPGFLAPYAYFELTAVDLGSGRVLRREKGLASTMISAARTDTGNPWDTLSGQQKVNKLVELVSTEINNVLPQLLKPS
jgi:hypothetical protein